MKNQLDHSLQPENLVKNHTTDKINAQEVTDPLETSQSIDRSEKSANLSYSVTQTTEKITQPKTLVINSLHDIVQLAEQHNDTPFKLLIKEFVHPVSFEAGHITLRLSENTPQFLAHDIEKDISMD